MEGVTLIRSLKIYPDAELLRQAEPVVEFDQALVDLGEEMIETCRRYDTALGLAAPQLGINKRIVVFQENTDLHTYRVLVNPSWTSTSEDAEMFDGIEGCLSFPGLQVKVCRYAAINVHAMTTNREPQLFCAVGLQARILQHECDHLEGIMIVDHMPKVSRSITFSRFIKARAKARRQVRAHLREQPA